MLGAKPFRFLIQLVAAAVFGYQTYTAFSKYLSDAVIVMESVENQKATWTRESLDVILCATEQFNDSLGHEHGYLNEGAFLYGAIRSYSWIMANEQKVSACENESRKDVEKKYSSIFRGNTSDLACQTMVDKIARYKMAVSEHETYEKHRVPSLSATADGGILNWGGSQNLSFDAMVKILYRADYDGIYYGQNRSTTDIFVVSTGHCKILKDYQLPLIGIYFLTENNYTVHIVNRNKSLATGFSKQTLTGDKISSSALVNGIKIFNLRLVHFHYSNEEGTGCVNYGNGERYKTHADCVDRYYEKYFMSILGCTVPWIRSGKLSCNRANLTSANIRAYKNEMKRLLLNVVLGNSINIKACPKPCHDLELVATQTYFTPRKDLRGLELIINRNVLVKRFEKMYGKFELVVDMGSSLGLWIGLSFLDVYDLLLEILLLLKKSFRMK